MPPGRGSRRERRRQAMSSPMQSFSVQSAVIAQGYLRNRSLRNLRRVRWRTHNARRREGRISIENYRPTPEALASTWPEEQTQVASSLVANQMVMLMITDMVWTTVDKRCFFLAVLL